MLEQIAQVYNDATLLYTTEQVEHALDQLAQDISQTLRAHNPIILGVMVGAIIPLGHLLTRLHFPLQVDYIHATRYAGNTQGGSLTWKTKPSLSLNDRHVLIVDDVLEDGITLQGLIDYCATQGAQHVYTAVLVDKQKKRPSNGVPQADFVGLTTDDRYLFGYGMDYHEYLRNLPGIYAI